jgi:hypothetical protein
MASMPASTSRRDTPMVGDRVAIDSATNSRCVLLAVQTNSEFVVYDQIRRFGIRVYLPKYLVRVTDEWRQLLELIRVKGFVRRGGAIVEVPPHVVAALRAREGPTGYVRIDRFFIGQQVRVTASGLVGAYDGLSDAHKARVLFTMQAGQSRWIFTRTN